MGIMQFQGVEDALAFDSSPGDQTTRRQVNEVCSFVIKGLGNLLQQSSRG
jgi:hypothetical protein